MKDLKKSIGQRVKLLRKAQKLSQESLAERMDRSVFTISQIERGVNFPKVDTLIDLAESLGCSVEDILFDQVVVGKGRRKSQERSALEAAIAADLALLDDRSLKAAQAAISGILASQE